MKAFMKSCPCWRRRSVLLLLAAVLLSSQTSFAQSRALFEDAPKVEWKELEVKLPAYPAAPNLIPLYVSPLATAQFFIDEKSLSLAEDGVVRYTLVVRAAGGAENVSYEGIRCETAERKLYAIGRGDGEWMRSRNDAWRRIENNALNRQHAALANDFFCPPGDVRPSLAQIVQSLRREGRLR